jgi:hypothetical protein
VNRDAYGSRPKLLGEILGGARRVEGFRGEGGRE